MAQPLFRRLPAAWTPEYCFRRLSACPGCVWLDSSRSSGSLGRYSYLAADPFSTVRIDKAARDAMQRVVQTLRPFQQPRLPELPPFQGGYLGWFGYELGGCFETIPAAQHNDFHLPLAQLGVYDVVLAWDHASNQGWMISQGWPERDGRSRRQRAYERIREFQRILEAPPQGPSRDQRIQRQYRLREQQLYSQYATRRSKDWTSSFTAEEYRRAIRKSVEYVHAGDVFQVNLAQRLLRRATCDPETLYLTLRRENPSPFSGYADFGRVQVASVSPERFLCLKAPRVEARPIKGTRPRLTDPIADAGMAELLQASEKDRAENVMIVDLMRNDLSRVSNADSVEVTALCELEKHPSVWHLVSEVASTLADDQTAFDLLAATFPGGSITGAPKIRAMEIIAELEPTVRGPYCGSLGYISAAGDMDLSILIRTITVCDGWWQLPVGGGIVADSDPSLEEQETWHKAEGILRAIDTLK